MQFTDVLTKKKYIAHQVWLRTDGDEGRRLDLRYVDLSGCDLSGADMRHAILRGADLFDANLQNANLTGADMTGANMEGADLQDANLANADMRRANLRSANLYGADMRDADLSGANIDFSAWPLSCGSFDVTVDKRIVSQLIYHVCKLRCDDDEVKELQETIKPFANKFHRIGKDVYKLD